MHDSNRDDIASGAGGRIDIVDLESDDVALGGHELLRSCWGTENQLVAQEDIDRRRNSRQGAPADRDPADRLLSEESQALGPTQDPKGHGSRRGLSLSRHDQPVNR